MKYPRLIFSIIVAVFSLAAPRVALAQATATPTPATPPVVVLHGNGQPLSPSLKGVPPAVASLIANFDALRDKYLLKQHLLLEQLANATTTEQRAAIRAQLQDNRQAFLDELSDFRVQLKDQLKGMQGRISNAEFLRIIDAAQTTAGDHHHRGH